MLRITIPMTEGFDEERSEFVVFNGLDVEIEHSLVSMSKWESKWEVPFLGSLEKTGEQNLDYVRMMILGEVPMDKDLLRMSPVNIRDIDVYINAKMTATTFSEKPNQKGGQEKVTSELIYYWMISYGIPFECQYWHLNRLITLIRVCSIKNAPEKKMTRSQAAARQRELNSLRRNQTGSKG